MSSGKPKDQDHAEPPNSDPKPQQTSKADAYKTRRAEVQARRKREEDETAAVLEEFVKSFDRDDRDFSRDARGGFGGGFGGSRRPPAPGGFGDPRPLTPASGGAARRHYLGGVPAAPSRGAPPPKSGPGSLGFVPSSLYGSKRTYDTYERDQKDARRAVGRLGFDNDPDRDGDGDNTNSVKNSGNDGGQNGGNNGDDGGDGGDAPMPRSVARAFDHSDDEDEKNAPASRDVRAATAKPTLKLTQLPPGSSPATIRALLPSGLVIEAVNILPSNAGHGSGPSTGLGSGLGPTARTERRCAVAIVTLSKDTPANDMDAAVSALQNRYLGFGYYLSLHRHLSSAVVASTTAVPSSLGGGGGRGGTSAGAQPFGAKPVPAGASSSGYGRRFASSSASSYNPQAGYRGAGGGGRGGSSSSLLHVPVRPPGCINTVRAINRVIEQLLVHGPEFEALLMSRAEVQRDEKWAWIWDARSEGGVWYRWKLWQVVTGGAGAAGGKYVPLFEGGHAWRAPDRGLVFEYTTAVDEFVSDSEYDSDEVFADFYDGDGIGNSGGRGNWNGGNWNGSGNRYGGGNRDNSNTQGAADEASFLSPLDKAKLVHLLARLPTVISRIRKGDVARIAAFAATHADRGADEVVDMVLANIEMPFALGALGAGAGAGSEGRPDHVKDPVEAPAAGPEGRMRSPALEDKPGETVAVVPTAAAPAAVATPADPSAARLVGLYVASDILSSSSSSGIRGAWRFRPLFETALREKKTFESLGMVAERLGWGRMRADKWKRSVGLVLGLWEGWCAFPAEVHKAFVDAFENPPSLRAEGGVAVRDDGLDDYDGNDGNGGGGGGRRGDAGSGVKGRQGWKVVDAGAQMAVDRKGGRSGDTVPPPAGSSGGDLGGGEGSSSGKPTEPTEGQMQKMEKKEWMDTMDTTDIMNTMEKTERKDADWEGQPAGNEDDNEDEDAGEDEPIGEPMSDEDIEGEPMGVAEEDGEGEPMEEEDEGDSRGRMQADNDSDASEHRPWLSSGGQGGIDVLNG